VDRSWRDGELPYPKHKTSLDLILKLDLLLQVGAIRAQPTHAQARLGPVTCMAFHPYQPLLVAAGCDSVCTVYAVDNHTGGLKPIDASQVSSTGGGPPGAQRAASGGFALAPALLASLGVTKSGAGSGTTSTGNSNSQLPRFQLDTLAHAHSSPSHLIPRVGRDQLGLHKSDSQSSESSVSS
jgi:hypothetical protein